MPCATCGDPMPEHNGRGRPRKHCTTCKPIKVTARKPSAKPSGQQERPQAGSLLGAVRAELQRMDAMGTSRGQAALDLAERIMDSRNDANAAALHKQLLVTLVEVEQRAIPDEYDPVAAAQADLHLVV